MGGFVTRVIEDSNSGCAAWGDSVLCGVKIIILFDQFSGTLFSLLSFLPSNIGCSNFIWWRMGKYLPNLSLRGCGFCVMIMCGDTICFCRVLDDGCARYLHFNPGQDSSRNIMPACCGMGYGGV